MYNRVRNCWKFSYRCIFECTHQIVMDLKLTPTSVNTQNTDYNIL